MEQQRGMFEEVDGDDLLAHLGDEPTHDHAWPQTLADLVDIMEDHLVRNCENEQVQARRLARELAVVLAKYFGGQPIYIPKGKQLTLAIRDTQIWHEFRGKNINELARRYQLTHMRIYDIVKKQRALHMEKIQPQLPL